LKEFIIYPLEPRGWRYQF